MIELGCATDFSGESVLPGEIYKALKQIKEAGFTHIHWCHEWDGDYTYSKPEMEQIGEWMHELGLKAKSLHATKGSDMHTTVRKEPLRRDYMSADEYSRRAGVELIKNRLELAEHIGAHEIVLHMNLPYVTFAEEEGSEEVYYSQVFKSFDELLPVAKEKGICICIENMLETPARLQYEQFDRIFGRYDKDFLGFCLDTGHANVVLGQKMPEFAERYKDRLRSIHLNDNLGAPAVDLYDRERITWACDMHLIPGEGNIPWGELEQILADSAYELPFVMELSCREKDEDAFLRRAYEAGSKLTEAVMRRRSDGISDHGQEKN